MLDTDFRYCTTAPRSAWGHQAFARLDQAGLSHVAASSRWSTALGWIDPTSQKIVSAVFAVLTLGEAAQTQGNKLRYPRTICEGDSSARTSTEAVRLVWSW